ncbi:MAG TPA: homoserine dehydrogenase [Candidatus Limnocylindrales bacterium]|nr:homoserine dehydrogenase [Candidatus Limnocylindrales bacterium]
MEVDKVKIGILGMGTVGGGVVTMLENSGNRLRDKADAELLLERVLVRDLSRLRTANISEKKLTVDADVILEDPSIDIIIELIGGIEPACSYITRALKNGKYVVTANKALMATHGADLLALARSCKRNIFYEASVGGGIPIIRPLKHCLAANQIRRVIGIVNGTTNYILTRMAQDNLGLQEALSEAQALGFAEADPSDDIEGKDAACKLVILAGLAFDSRADIERVYVQGIDGVTDEDINYAREIGYTVKLLAIGELLPEGLALRVHPTLVPDTHPLASVKHEFNAVFIEGDAVGEVMFYGRGAGAMPTASAVLADVVEAVRCIRYQLPDGAIETTQRKVAHMPVTALTTSFYLRLLAQDRPGVFAALATAFGDEQVSLDMIIQKRSTEGTAEIVLITHNVLEETFNRAMEKIKQIPAVKQSPGVIRLLG